MGWWKIDPDSTQNLYLGDEPLDIVTDMLDGVSRVYEQGIGRKPMLAEVVKAIEICVGAAADEYLSDCDELEVVALQVETRKRGKKQTYKVGDFFAVPLGRKQYGFGRILEKNSQYGLLVVIFNITNRRILHSNDLKEEPQLFPPVYCGTNGLEEWRWKVIEGVPLEAGEYPVPKFKLGGLLPGEGWRIRQDCEEYPATTEEVEGLEKLVLWSPEGVERRMRQAFELE